MYRSKLEQKSIRNKPVILVIAAVFAISFLSLLLGNLRTERVLYYFPDSVSGVLIGEYRAIPRKGELPTRLQEYIHEYILGPTKVKSLNIFLRSTTIRSLFVLKGGRAVINFADTVLEEASSKGPDITQSLSILEDGIQANFPRVNEVNFLIEGQELYRAPYAGE